MCAAEGITICVGSRIVAATKRRAGQQGRMFYDDSDGSRLTESGPLSRFSGALTDGLSVCLSEATVKLHAVFE